MVLEQEAECERLFYSFCPHDDKGMSRTSMDEAHMVSFLRHCRLLSKGQFSVHNARELFQELTVQPAEKLAEGGAEHDKEETNKDEGEEGERSKEEQAAATARLIDYRVFREGVLPRLAATKGLQLDRVMFLLSR